MLRHALRRLLWIVQILIGVTLTSFALLIYALLFAPIVVLILFSFNLSRRNFVWTGFTFDWYPKLFANRDLLDAVGVTMEVALIAVIGATSWMQVARVIYGETLRFKAQDFVLAAEAMGAGRAAILIRHVLPQTIPSVVVSATLGVGFAILTEAAISYLGLGIQPPTPSWGNMLQNAQQYVWTSPALAIAPT